LIAFNQKPNIFIFICVTQYFVNINKNWVFNEDKLLFSLSKETF